MANKKICKTCIENDNGFCDRKGIFVKDSDVCEKHISGYNWAELIMKRFMNVN